jgi:glutaredoxin
MSSSPEAAKQATLYRMVMPEHTCPWGLKAKDLLRREGFDVDDRHLATHEATEAFKGKHGVRRSSSADSVSAGTRTFAGSWASASSIRTQRVTGR